MTRRTPAILIAMLQILPLTAQYNSQEPGDAPQLFYYTSDSTPLQQPAGCGNGVYGYDLRQLPDATELPGIEPPRLLRAHPHPELDSVTIEYELEDPAVIRFQMVNAQGNVVLETPYAATSAFRQTETRAIKNAAPGAYVLMIQIDGKKLAQCDVVIR